MRRTPRPRYRFRVTVSKSLESKFTRLSACQDFIAISMLLDESDHLSTVEGKQVLKRAGHCEAERALGKCTMENLR